MTPQEIAKDFIKANDVNGYLFDSRSNEIKLEHLLAKYGEQVKSDLMILLESNEKKTVKQIVQYLKGM